LFPVPLMDEAVVLVAEMKSRALMVATAESCTGGLLAGLLTEVPGSSSVVERGFVTYSNGAKIACLGVPPEMIDRHGAVSEETARAMAEGALTRSDADIAISITGIAGPGGGSTGKPVGLVHLAVAAIGVPTHHRKCVFGDIGRREVRLATLSVAMELLRSAMQRHHPG
jgi:nicotinamide-nucleotide amidase